MGLDMTLLTVDWERLQEIAPRGRVARLLQLDFLDDDDESGIYDWGLVWPVKVEERWCAKYEFCMGVGSYKPHFWAGQAWNDIREGAEPTLRATFDDFLDGLIWEPPDAEDLEESSGLFPREDGWGQVPLLVLCTPPQVAVRAQTWVRAEARLAELREPFTLHAAGRYDRVPTFVDFAALLRDWGAVVQEAERREWGLVGLPY
ncbi:hypothetical protein [Streptomyces longispororuber]|uniref:hypothetical protein n=1 Tax=Streptomyces longispororuber TaxID=68230 RepID=UPI0036FD21AC